MKEVYREAFSEIDEIFKLMPISFINKIPIKFRNMIHNEKSKEYQPIIEEPLENYTLKDETIIILSLIYRDFLCSKEEKEKLKLRDTQRMKEVEDELREKYNVDNLFKNRQKAQEDEQVQTNNSLLAIEEEKWYKKLFNIIKKLFKKG